MAISYIHNPTQYLNLTSTLLTINKQQIRSLLRERFYWMCYYELWTGILARSDNLKLKHLNGFVSYKHAAFHFRSGYLIN